MPSNQQVAFNTARDAHDDAVKAGVDGKTLAKLKAAKVAAENDLRSNGGKPGGGMLG